jgi:hypothetical protein
MRKIEVDGVEYEWQVGRTVVHVRGPDNFKLILPKVDATGGYHAERDFEKGTASITPSMIADRIREHVSAE